jgi:subtilisin-like proprotein convertase family protein
LVAIALLALMLGSPSRTGEAAGKATRPKQDQVPLTPAKVPVSDTYRSPGDRHKVEIENGSLVASLQSAGARVVANYGSYTLVEVDTSTAQRLTSQEQGVLRDENNLILLNAGAVETASDVLREPGIRTLGSKESKMLLVQFPGPVKPEWYQQLVATGVEIVSYIPNNAYLVFGDGKAIGNVRSLNRGLLQWQGEYKDEYKIQPSVDLTALKGQGDQNNAEGLKKDSGKGLRKGGVAGTESDGDTFQIQIFKSARSTGRTAQLVEQVALQVLSKWDALNYTNMVVKTTTDNLVNIIAKQPDVVSVAPYEMPRKLDERQNRIISGQISGGVPIPGSWLAYLASKGLTQAQFDTSNFLVNISDSGIDNANPAAPNHFAFYKGGVFAGGSRLVYARLLGTPNSGSTLQGCDGHGTENGSIIMGFVPSGTVGGVNYDAAPHADASNFHWGLGVAPFVKLGSSVIFDPDTFTSPNLVNLEAQAYNDGSRISSNSWGANTGGAYTVDSQTYDSLVRDAQPASSSFPTAGNQENVIIFAAGNAGSGLNTVGSPGSGKNVITVGASEGVLAFPGADACGIGDSGADNSFDIIAFSSRGPTDDARKKPEIVAPGTHITGVVAQASALATGTGAANGCFDATGVCAGPGTSNFFPLGQQFYTASDGTSHSTPAVAGAAALLRQFFINQLGTPPSPAMTKGVLMNSTTYMNGAGANDNLWSNSQGMGLMNIDAAFTTISGPKILRDQVAADTFTASGQQRIFLGSVADNTKPFRVTLAWTDAPGPTSGNAFVNNLDLEVIVGGNTYKGNVFTGANSAPGGSADAADNAESVFLPAGVSGPVLVRVKATNIAGDGVPNSGGPLDQDFALVVSNTTPSGPAPFIDGAGATITSESCAPASGAIDPNETVTVSLCVSNVGSANTTNLIGTLQATGGVTSPSGPQSFGVVVAGGPAVCRNFTFTADALCGDTLTATLDLTDGGSLGTVAYNFPVGILSVPTTTTYSSGNIAVPIPDVSTVDVPINIPDAGVVSDVNVRVRLNHTFDGDLVIALVHPDNTVVPLANNRGGSGLNYGTGTNDCAGTSTVFDDAGGTAISGGTAPFAGTFRPESPLSALNGKPTAGVWKLRVSDTAALDTGTIGCVSLVVARSTFLCCPFSGTPNIVGGGPPVLVTEGCPPANGGPDPNENVTMSFSLQNTGTGSTTNLVATLQATGGVTAPSSPQSYGAIAPGGTASRNFSFVPSGSCGGTITATLQLQDGATNLGTVTFTITLGGISSVTSTFTNPTSIVIPNPPSTGTATGAPSNPYPSNITVGGVTGTVTKVTVQLLNISHTFPDDIDVLLVGPGGQKMLLMSDVGSTNDLVNVSLTLDDAAAASLPDSAQIVTGTFKPTNIGTGDAFPAPAPAGPYPDPQLLSIFNGLNPNGTWSLYVVDDLGGDTGNMAGGWSLSITATEPVCCVSSCTITCPANITVSNAPNQCGQVVTYPAPTTSGSCGTVTCSPASGSFFPVGTTNVTCTSSAGPSCTFTITVNDTQPPTIICPPNQTVVSANPGDPVVVNYPLPTVTDNCPGATVICTPPSGSTFPPGTTTVTCTATDGAGNTASCSFTVSTFDAGLQDDSGNGVLVWSSTSGAYQMCIPGGTTFTGTGTVSSSAGVFTLTHNALDRRLNASFNNNLKRGSAAFQNIPGHVIYSITDRSTLNDTFVCPP